MASAALEKSLDEIIGERAAPARRGPSNRPWRTGPRHSPYDRLSRESRARNDRTSVDRASSDDRWPHDKYEASRGNSNEHHRKVANGRDARATRLRVSNIHYDLTENEVRDLFERIAPVVRFSMRFDRAGRSEGLAFITYDQYRDAKLAIAEFDGQFALGQALDVQLDSIVPSPRMQDHGDLKSRVHQDSRDQNSRRSGPSNTGRSRRGGKQGASSSTRTRGPVTVDDLDAELENYINQRNNGDSQKVAETGAGADDEADGMLID